MSSRFRKFPTTVWPAVHAAAKEEAHGPRKALDALLRQYMPAMRSYLMDTFRFCADEADDVLQEFVRDRFLARSLLTGATPVRGRFRSLLVTSLRNYVVSRHRRLDARKRKPQGVVGPGGVEGTDLIQKVPDRTESFDLAWARETMAEAVRRLRVECEQKNRSDLWGVFEGRVLRTLLGGEARAYEDLVKEFAFSSPEQASNALVSAKRLYMRCLRRVVGEYAGRQEDIEQEIAGLRQVLEDGHA